MLTMGHKSYCAGPIYNNFSAPIVVGKYCSLGPGLTVIDSNHPMRVSTFPFHEVDKLDYPPCRTLGQITIGHDVWIGLNVSLKAGITIGNGAIIAACSVVTKSIPNYTIYGGNPAVFISRRFSEGHCYQLSLIKWWDWPDEWIRERIQDFKDINLFIKKYGGENETNET